MSSRKTRKTRKGKKEGNKWNKEEWNKEEWNKEKEEEKMSLVGGAIRPDPSTRKNLYTKAAKGDDKDKTKRKIVMFYTKDYLKNNELGDFEAYLQKIKFKLMDPPTIMEIKDKLQNPNTSFPILVQCIEVENPNRDTKIPLQTKKFKIYKNRDEFEKVYVGKYGTSTDLYKNNYEEEMVLTNQPLYESQMQKYIDETLNKDNKIIMNEPILTTKLDELLKKNDGVLTEDVKKNILTFAMNYYNTQKKPSTS